MKDVKVLLSDLRKNNVRVSLNGDKLEVASLKGQLTKETIEEIRSNKEQLIDYLKKRNELDQNGQVQINCVPLSESYPLSSSQRRLWVLNQLNDKNTAYNVVGSNVFEGHLNTEALELAFTLTIERHEILRTVFKLDENGDVKQFIRGAQEFNFKIKRIDIQQEAHKETRVCTEVDREINTPFNLAEGPLLRANLFQVEAHKWIFVLNMHHIVSDGWSIGVLTNEILAHYNSILQNTSGGLEEMRIQYKDYAVWQQEQLAGKNLRDHKSYWLDKFSGELPLIDLPLDYQRPREKTFEGGTIIKTIPPVLVKELNLYCKEQGGSLFMGLIAVINTLLFRYTAQEDIIIGSPVAGRENPELSNQIGFYVNTLCFRNRVNAELTFNDLFREVKTTILEAYTHQVYPFDQIVDELNIPRDPGRNVLFDVMVGLSVVDKHDSTEKVELEGVSVSPYQEVELMVSKFDLLFDFIQSGDELSVSVEYSSDLFKKESIQRLLVHLVNLMKAIVSKPSQAIAALDYLSPAEKKTILIDFNHSEVLFGEPGSLLDLFEHQVQLTPQLHAIVYKDSVFSYSQLNEKAEHLAAYLHTTFNIQPGDTVGILLERSEWMIVGILGILKTGAAYVPIDLSYPAERIAFIQKDSCCKLIFSQPILLEFLALDTHDKAISFPKLTGPSGLAYIIYTSGSTGNPKGVMIEHSGIVNTILAQRKVLDIQEKERGLQFASFSFDASVSEVFTTITSGACLYIIDEESKKDPALVEAYIRNNEIDFATIPPAFLQVMDTDKIKNLKKLITAGEAPVRESVLAFSKSGAYFNAYGPSETSICATMFHLDSSFSQSAGAIPIGKPIANTSVYVLDAFFNPVPVGISGEIYISGPGLARGYVNNPSLTSKTFLPNPFSEGQKMYRTGDFGKWLPDGNLVFMGRKDEQVKIRSYRIELTEITAVLLAKPDIEDGVVVCKTDSSGEKILIAYLVSKSKLNTTELHEHLSTKLPAYMIPASFVQLDLLPLTTSGKLNHKALPATHVGLTSARVFAEPANETENKLVALWKDILAIEKVSTKDSFFELGGHSLKAIRLLSLIHKEFHVKLELKQLFSTTSLEEQAALISAASKLMHKSIPTAAVQTSYPLSSSQRRLWVLDKLDENSNAYTIPGLYELEGSLDRNSLSEAFRLLIGRHEILRTVFIENESGEPRQQILPDCNFSIRYTDLRQVDEKDAQLRAYAQKNISVSFDLKQGPLFAVNLYQLSDNKYVLVYVTHHIISDGWSMHVLIRELITLYNSCVQGIKASDVPLRIQYKDYACWQQEELTGANLETHKRYWLDQFSGEPPLLELPTDHSRPAIKTYRGSTFQASLENTASRALKDYSQTHEGTLFMGLLSLVNILLFRYSHQQDIIIGTPIAGREHSDLDNQIGFYVNTLALRSRFKGEDSFDALFQNTKDLTLSAYEHQVYPFDALVDALNIPRDISRSPLFDVMIVLQNSAIENTETLEMDGLNIRSYDQTEVEVSKFDLSFNFLETAKGIELLIEYNTDLYERETIMRMSAHLDSLLKSAMASPDKALSTLGYLSPVEERQLLVDFNQTESKYPADKTLVSLFEDQVLKQPAHIALTFKNRSLTFDELNKQANQFAAYLTQQYAVHSGDLLAVKLDRSEWMLVVLMGILKSGAAYVPIDPEYPQERVAYILADTKSKVLIDEKELGLFEQKKQQYSPLNPEQIIKPHDLAYVIYTSGSTGQPKGCMLEHGSVVNRIDWMWQKYRFSASDVILQKTTYTFDVSVWELFMPLCWGASMVVCERTDVGSPERILSLITDHRITCLHFVPSMLNAFVGAVFSGAGLSEKLKSLRCVITSGEALSAETIHTWYAQTDIVIHNLYGPTEAAIDVTYYETKKGDKTIPIGRPIGNTQMYILGSSDRLVPIGVSGEICIGGIGLARGYLNKPELTAQKFIANPFHKNDILYRTGDLGKWLPDGNIDYLGRIDDQVKIRGYRIELGEITVLLQGSPDIQEAVVVCRTNPSGDKVLVAYVVSTKKINSAELRTYLGSRLPAYMIPSFFIQLDHIPLTESGKISRKNLPSPTDSTIDREGGYKAPGNETQKELVSIWKEILGIETIGITDNFFELGGNSLNAIKLCFQVNKKLKMTMKLKDIYNSPTIERMSAFNFKQANMISFYPKSDKARKNIYLIPPVFGTSALYKDLADTLSDFNCYGLQYPGFETNEALPSSIRQIAESFCAEIRSHQAGGNFFILGYSMGAAIAFEITKILEQEFEKVTLVLVDKDVQRETVVLLTAKEIAQRAEELLSIHPDWMANQVTENMLHLKAYLKNNISILADYSVKGKIKSRIIAFEAKGNKYLADMRDWEDYTEGSFQHHELGGSHWEALSEFNLPAYKVLIPAREKQKDLSVM